MASYTLICVAFLVVCSFSIIETSSATRSGPTSTSESSIHVTSEPVKPPRPSNNNKLESSIHVQSSNNNKGLKQSTSESSIHVQSEPVKPPRPSYNNKDLKQSTAQVVTPSYPYSGQGYPYSGQGYPYSGQGYPYSGQPYLPNYRIPPLFPTIAGPFSYPYSSYNPTYPYSSGTGSTIYGPPSNGDASDSSKARP